jgi:hypothetical protein
MFEMTGALAGLEPARCFHHLILRQTGGRLRFPPGRSASRQLQTLHGPAHPPFTLAFASIFDAQRFNLRHYTRRYGDRRSGSNLSAINCTGIPASGSLGAPTNGRRPVALSRRRGGHDHAPDRGRHAGRGRNGSNHRFSKSKSGWCRDTADQKGLFAVTTFGRMQPYDVVLGIDYPLDLIS